MPCSNRFSLCLLVSFALLIAVFPVPSASAQNTDDDVHIKPRIEPKPATDNIKELEQGFSPHTKPLKSTEIGRAHV